jgi:ankyrin repeat protein
MPDNSGLELGCSFDLNEAEQAKVQRERQSESNRKSEKLTDQAMKYINDNELSALVRLLNQTPKYLKMTDLVDSDGFTLLHMAVFTNRFNIVEVLIARAKD